MDWQRVEEIAQNQGFGRIFVELVVHEKSVTTANVQGTVQSIMYKDTEQAKKDVAAAIEVAQKLQHNGDMTITATFKEGQIKQLQYSPMVQLKSDVAKKR